MSRRLRVGVLGCSAIAWRRTIPAIRSCEQLTLVAVASRDSAKAARFADAFHCAATDYAGLLARDDIDAVYLPLPPALHARWGAAVLRSGKHLLCEKPIATNAADGRLLVELAAELGLTIGESMSFPYHAQHAAVRALLAEGRLGELRSLSASFCFPPLPAGDIRYDPALGGGALLDAGVYPLRAARLFLGPDLTLVGACLRMSGGVDVAGQAQLVSAGDVLVDVRFGFQHSYASRYELWGSGARLNVERAFAPPPDWVPTARVTEQAGVDWVGLPCDDQVARCVEAFADAALAGKRDGLADALWTLELVDRINATAVRV